MCKKQFKTKGIRDTGSKEEEADTVYPLAKKLPHALVSGENEKFKELLAQTEAKDIVAFAQAVGQQAKEIDRKVCNKKVWKAKGGSHEKARDEAVADENGRWSCTDYELGTDQTNNTTAYLDEGRGFMWRFGDASRNKMRGNKHATTQNNNTADTDRGLTNSGWPGTESGNTKTAEGMAGDLRGLDKEQRNKVAGLLSKTISGAEVVEIRAVSTTSVMLNACYDKRKGAVALRSLFSWSSSYMNIFC